MADTDQSSLSAWLEAQPHISRIGAFVFALMARPRAAGSDFAVWRWCADRRSEHYSASTKNVGSSVI